MIGLRAPEPSKRHVASALCIRSKASWGYDEAFMAACKAELSLTEEDISTGLVMLAIENGDLAGVAQITQDGDETYLEKLFVEPDHMGKGVGRELFGWSHSTAARLGAAEMIVEADPGAVPFYLAMGCKQVGTAPSGSIPGRTLPRLVYVLADNRDTGQSTAASSPD